MTGPEDPWAWVDGAYVRASSACVRLDRCRPWEAFGLAENLPCENGAPRDLAAHLERLAEGCKALAWAPPPRKTLSGALAGLARRNRVVRGGLRVRWWGSLDRPLLLAQSVAVSAAAGPRRSGTGGALRLMTSAVRHFGPDSLNARLKAGQMLPNLLARAEVSAFAEDGLRLTPDGMVAEGVFSNVALLRRGVVRTPPVSSGLLEGVTRSKFLARARKSGLTVREEPVTRFDLWTAEKVWVLSSLRGALPVASVDGRPVG